MLQLVCMPVQQAHEHVHLHDFDPAENRLLSTEEEWLTRNRNSGDQKWKRQKMRSWT